MPGLKACLDLAMAGTRRRGASPSGSEPSGESGPGERMITRRIRGRLSCSEYSSSGWKDGLASTCGRGECTRVGRVSGTMQGMTAIARLGAISLDAPDPAVLSRFYQQLLGLDVYFESPTFVALRGGPVLITIQQVADLPAVTWPEGPVPKQFHLDLAVTDLDVSEKAAVEIGAVKAETQPAPDRWRVLIDPAGHPFCLTNQIPET